MAVRMIAVAVFATVAVLATVGVALVLILNQLTEGQEDASARRTDQSTQRVDADPQALVGEVEQEVRLVAIVPSPRIVRLDGPGETEQLSVRGYYSDRSESDLDDGALAAISYASSDPTVAQVDSHGVVTGLDTGGANIAVSYGDLAATVSVFVWGPMRAVPPIDPERVLEVSDDGSAIVLNRVMVELQPGYDVNDAEEVAGQIGGQVVFEYRTFPGYLVEFEGGTQEELGQALSIFQDDRRVAAAYPDIVLASSQGDSERNVPIETLLPGLAQHNRAFAYVEAGMAEAWKTMNLSGAFSPVTVVVIDDRFLIPPSGDDDVDAVLQREFDYERIDVKDAVDLAGRNAPWRDPNSPEGEAHGVEVASILVARNNDRNDSTIPEQSFSGIITSVNGLDYHLVVYQVEGGRWGLFNAVPARSGPNGGAVTAALEDVYWYQDQVDVVNLSLMFSCWLGPVCGLYEGFDGRWVELMQRMPNVTFVSGSGKHGKDVGGIVPASLSTELTNAITVGGTAGRKPYLLRAPGSNFGTAITIGAPYTVWTVRLENESGYGEPGGTSYSAPMVSGTVALLKALDSDLTPEEIKDILVSTGSLLQVCNSNEIPCPVGYQDRWSFLNAGEAVSALLWPSVDAEIDLPTGHAFEASLGDYFELVIPVANVGARDWEFYVSAEAFSHSSDKKYDLVPVRSVVPVGETHPFKMGFSPDEVATWTLEVKIHRTPEMTSTADSKLLLLQVGHGTASGAVSGGAQPADNVAAEGRTMPVAATGRAALTTLYHATDGTNWELNTNWLTDAPIGEWAGVATDADGRVIGLHLSANQLSGSIPSELGDLANLQELDLSANQLSGSIPSELGDLANLQELDLSANQLSGSIPSELGDLANLQELDLSANQLSGSIPSGLGNLTNLETLLLGGNQLSGEIPPELSAITHLRWLALYGNQLTGEIPPELGMLTNLEDLGVSANDLVGEIPPALGMLTNLKSLWLSDNRLTGEIPAELGNLANLEGLYLHFNRLSGPIPSELGNLTNLGILWLSDNQLTGAIPAEFGNLTNLEGLFLQFNQLSGEIPPEMGNLTNLKHLQLYGNQFTGCVPPGLRDESGTPFLTPVLTTCSDEPTGKR